MTRWFTSDNSVYPLDCAFCFERKPELCVCSSCFVRTCAECKSEAIEKHKQTWISKEIQQRRAYDAVLAGAWQRPRSNTAGTDATIRALSRPASPGLLTPALSPYDNASASRSATSLRNQHSQGNMRQAASQGNLRVPTRGNHPPVAFRTPNQTPYQPRSPGHSNRGSSESFTAPPDAPPMPGIPAVYYADRNSTISGPLSARSPEGDMMRGRRPFGSGDFEDNGPSRGRRRESSSHSQHPFPDFNPNIGPGEYRNRSRDPSIYSSRGVSQSAYRPSPRSATFRSHGPSRGTTPSMRSCSRAPTQQEPQVEDPMSQLRPRRGEGPYPSFSRSGGA